MTAVVSYLHCGSDLCKAVWMHHLCCNHTNAHLGVWALEKVAAGQTRVSSFSSTSVPVCACCPQVLMVFWGPCPLAFCCKGVGRPRNTHGMAKMMQLELSPQPTLRRVVYTERLAPGSPQEAAAEARMELVSNLSPQAAL